MHKVWAVIRREFVTRVRTRAFVLSTVMLPLLMVTVVFLPALLADRETGPKRVAIVDGMSDTFGVDVEHALRESRRPNGRGYYVVHRVPAPGRVDAVRDSLVELTGRSGHAASLDGVLVLSDSAVEEGRLSYLGANVGSPSDMSRLRSELEQLVRVERLRRAGIDPSIVRARSGPVSLDARKVTEGQLTGESGEASFFLAYFMSAILYFSLLIYGLQVMNSIVEEKANRIVEVLISSLTPFQMMLGKVLGVGATGLLQVSIWAGTATLLTNYRGAIGRALGMPSIGAMSLPIPTMSPSLLAVFLIFFVLGFTFYAALYAAVGAICNSAHDTQQAQMPVTMVVVAGFISTFALLSEPNGSLARVLSLVPFLSPFVVPVRYSIGPIPAVELLAAMATTVAGTLAVVWIAARIYRVGILMYGKKPGLGELLRWVRST
jgi:ABC-2 type transport system permease protein